MIGSLNNFVNTSANQSEQLPTMAYMDQAAYTAPADPKFKTLTFTFYSAYEFKDVTRYTLLASNGSLYLGQTMCSAGETKYLRMAQLVQGLYEELPEEKFFPMVNVDTITVYNGPIDDVHIKRQNVTSTLEYSSRYLKFLTRELIAVDAMSKRPHPNLCAYRGAVVNEFSKRVVGLAYKKYSTDLWMFAQTQRLTSRDQIKKIAGCIAAALQHLHSQGTVHCDVHPGNIFLTVGPHDAANPMGKIEEVVLGDFDACCKVGEVIVGKRAAAEWIGEGWGSQSKAIPEMDYCALESVKRWMNKNMVPEKKD